MGCPIRTYATDVMAMITRHMGRYLWLSGSVENGQPSILHGGCQGEHAKALVDRRENLCIRS